MRHLFWLFITGDTKARANQIVSMDEINPAVRRECEIEKAVSTYTYVGSFMLFRGNFLILQNNSCKCRAMEPGK